MCRRPYAWKYHTVAHYVMLTTEETHNIYVYIIQTSNSRMMHWWTSWYIFTLAYAYMFFLTRASQAMTWLLSHSCTCDCARLTLLCDGIWLCWITGTGIHIHYTIMYMYACIAVCMCKLWDCLGQHNVIRGLKLKHVYVYMYNVQYACRVHVETQIQIPSEAVQCFLRCFGWMLLFVQNKQNSTKYICTHTLSYMYMYMSPDSPSRTQWFASEERMWLWEHHTSTSLIERVFQLQSWQLTQQNICIYVGISDVARV